MGYEVTFSYPKPTLIYSNFADSQMLKSTFNLINFVHSRFWSLISKFKNIFFQFIKFQEKNSIEFRAYFC